MINLFSRHYDLDGNLNYDQRSHFQSKTPNFESGSSSRCALKEALKFRLELE